LSTSDEPVKELAPPEPDVLPEPPAPPCGPCAIAFWMLAYALCADFKSPELIALLSASICWLIGLLLFAAPAGAFCCNWLKAAWASERLPELRALPRFWNSFFMFPIEALACVGSKD